jgi:putative transposase
MTVKKHDVPEELIDSLMANYRKPEDLIGENGLLKQLTKILVEKALEAEIAEHLGHGKNQPVENPAGNTRNGKSKKTLKGKRPAAPPILTGIEWGIKCPPIFSGHFYGPETLCSPTALPSR